MDPWTVGLAGAGAVALVACVVLVLGVLHHVGAAAERAREQEARAGAAELQIERDRRERAEALAEARRLRLVEAARRALERARGAQLAADRAAEVDRAVADAGGDVDAALERLLQLEDARAAAGRGDAAGGSRAPAGAAGAEGHAGGAAGVVADRPAGPDPAGAHEGARLG